MPPKNTQTWPIIVGAGFIFLTILFLMILVIIAVVMEKEVPRETRFLVVAVMALTTGAGTGFLGGSAKASGNLAVPGLKTPIQIGVTGGIATVVIMLLLGHQLYSKDGHTSEQLATAEEKTKLIEQELEQSGNLSAEELKGFSELRKQPGIFVTESSREESQQTVEKLVNTVSSRFGISDGKISKETSLEADLGLSMPTRRALAVPLSKAFDVQISSMETSEANTVGNLVDLVNKKLAAQPDES